jgi:hypothetical protein
VVCVATSSIFFFVVFNMKDEPGMRRNIFMLGLRPSLSDPYSSTLLLSKRALGPEKVYVDFTSFLWIKL